MSHLVLSRKYRPQNFDELAGQDHVGRILRNAVTSGRVGHAYLFVGPRGVGKTTTARIFARALNCSGRPTDDEGRPTAPDPCGRCGSCRDIAAGSDLDVVEMDAASNNHVEDVRRLREQVGYATVRSRHRIWIVDEVHMLSLPAFNAFLKTLEEPPDGVIFVFCTTEEHKLPETFRSRCQRLEFRPIDAKTMATRLEDLAGREGIEAEPGLLEEIAVAAAGGLRDAESMLEQLIAACPDGRLGREDLDTLAGRAPRSLLDAVVAATAAGDAAGALDAVDAALATGCKPGILVDQWLDRLREGLVGAARGPGVRTVPSGVPRLAHAIDVLLEKRLHLRSGADGVLVCQVAAVELARLPEARDLDALLAALETSDATGAPAAAEGAGSRGGGEPPPRSVESPRADAPPAAAEDLPSRWDALILAVAERDGRLAEALRRTRPLGIRDDRLDLEVARGDVLARSTLERRESRVLLRDVASGILGRPLGVRLLDAEGEAPAASARPVAEEHPDVRRVREATGGQLIDLERTPRRRKS